jgi:hypothetical protein
MVKKNKSIENNNNIITQMKKSTPPIASKIEDIPVIKSETNNKKLIKIKKNSISKSNTIPNETNTIAISSPIIETNNVINTIIPENVPEITKVEDNVGKRGRKPRKNNIEIDIKSVSSQNSNSSISSTNKILNSPKKRGRKPKEKTGNVIINTTEIENDNIIIHLPIKPNNIKNSNDLDIFKYNPNVPEPVGYEELTDQVQFISQKNNPNKQSELMGEGPKPNSSFCLFPFDEKERDIFEVLEQEENGNNVETIETIIPEIKHQINNSLEVVHNDSWYKNVKIPVSNNNDNIELNHIIEQIKKQRDNDFENMNIKTQKNTVEKCLIQFDEANKTNSWPTSTSIYCWWCSHPFSTPPCSLPSEYKNGTFTVCGIFCSPECAAAYNFDDVHSGCDVWERYTLLNFMYRKIYNDKKIRIKSAPPRQTLKIFGGNLTIKEFRMHNTNYEMNYKIIMPPMTSIIPIQEISSIDKGYSSKNEKKMVLIEKDKISTTFDNSNLKLKRDKPISNNNTLDKCMLNLNNSSIKDDSSILSEL